MIWALCITRKWVLRLVLIGICFISSCSAVGRTKVRALGGYERLLSRLTPGTNSLSLSHASAVVLNKRIEREVLVEAVTVVMEKQPMLRSYIDRPEAGEYNWMYCDKPLSDLAKDVVTTVQVDSLVEGWQAQMQASLNNVEFVEQGPLWRLINVESLTSDQSAWVFCVNHGADDQRSVNSVIGDLVASCNAIKDKGEGVGVIGEPLTFPESMEDAMVQGAQFPLPQTLCWAAFQVANSLRMPAMIPWHISRGAKNKETRFQDPNERETFCEFLHLDEGTVTSLRNKGRGRGVTLTSVLSAAMLSITNAAIQTQGKRTMKPLVDLPLRFLLSVDLRPYGSQISMSKGGVFTEDWTGGAVACAAGAVDYVIKVPEAASREEGQEDEEQVWQLAQRCQDNSRRIISDFSWVPESVRLFGFGMRYAQVLPLVEADAKSSRSLGRGFSCGVSNMGLAKFPQVPRPQGSSGDKSNPGGGDNSDLKVEQVYYGTSHARNGVLCQLSCMSVQSDNSSPFYGTLQFTKPLISREDARVMRDRLVALLTRLAKE